MFGNEMRGIVMSIAPESITVADIRIPVIFNIFLFSFFMYSLLLFFLLIFLLIFF